MSPSRSTRTRAQMREEMQAGILRAGRAQLAERGATALSLREIARELGVVSSAIYRYVSSRDELLTLLLVDAYDDLADHVDARLDRARRSSPATRLRLLGESMREWALAHPAQWGLIYGTPVPGYAAPEELTGRPGTRVMVRLASIAGEGRPGGSGDRGARRARVGRAYAAFVREAAHELGVEAEAEQMALALEAWVAIVGAVSAEVFGQLGPGAEAIGADVMRRLTEAWSDRLGLPTR